MRTSVPWGSSHARSDEAGRIRAIPPAQAGGDICRASARIARSPSKLAVAGSSPVDRPPSRPVLSSLPLRARPVASRIASVRRRDEETPLDHTHYLATLTGHVEYCRSSADYRHVRGWATLGIW